MGKRGRPRKQDQTLALPPKMAGVVMPIVILECNNCHLPVDKNTDELWYGEPGNSITAWWNHMDYHCPHCNCFQNAGWHDKYVQPSGKRLENGRRIITLIVQKSNVFPPQESAKSQPMSD